MGGPCSKELDWSGVHGEICTESCWAELLYDWDRSQGLLSLCWTGSCGTVWKGAVIPEPSAGSLVQMLRVGLSQRMAEGCSEPELRISQCPVCSACVSRFVVWEGGSSRQNLKIWMIMLWKKNCLPSSAGGLAFCPPEGNTSSPEGLAVPRAGSAQCRTCWQHPGPAVIPVQRGDGADPIVLATRGK